MAIPALNQSINQLQDGHLQDCHCRQCRHCRQSVAMPQSITISHQNGKRSGTSLAGRALAGNQAHAEPAPRPFLSLPARRATREELDRAAAAALPPSAPPSCPSRPNHERPATAARLDAHWHPPQTDLPRKSPPSVPRPAPPAPLSRSASAPETPTHPAAPAPAWRASSPRRTHSAS